MRLCSWPLLPLPLFCICTLQCILAPLLPLGWWFSGCASIFRICNSCVVLPVFICFPNEGSWDAPLSYFRELVYHWLIYILFISESQDTLAQFMANLSHRKYLIEMCKNYACWFMINNFAFNDLYDGLTTWCFEGQDYCTENYIIHFEQHDISNWKCRKPQTNVDNPLHECTKAIAIC